MPQRSMDESTPTRRIELLRRTGVRVLELTLRTPAALVTVRAIARHVESAIVGGRHGFSAVNPALRAAMTCEGVVAPGSNGNPHGR